MRRKPNNTDSSVIKCVETGPSLVRVRHVAPPSSATASGVQLIAQHRSETVTELYTGIEPAEKSALEKAGQLARSLEKRTTDRIEDCPPYPCYSSLATLPLLLSQPTFLAPLPLSYRDRRYSLQIYSVLNDCDHSNTPHHTRRATICLSFCMLNTQRQDRMDTTPICVNTLTAYPRSLFCHTSM